jgi:hypothetical protein
MTSTRRAVAWWRLVALAAILALTSAAGCDAAPVADPVGAGGDGGADTGGGDVDELVDPEVVLGQGYDAYLDAGDGLDLTIYFGPQGGTHVYGSIRIAGLDPGDPALAISNKANPTVHYLVERLTDGEVVAESTLHFPFTEVAGEPGWYELVGLTMFLVPKTCDATVGHELRVTLDVTDAAGVTASDSRVWLAVEDAETCPIGGTGIR